MGDFQLNLESYFFLEILHELLLKLDSFEFTVIDLHEFKGRVPDTDRGKSSSGFKFLTVCPHREDDPQVRIQALEKLPSKMQSRVQFLCEKKHLSGKVPPEHLP